MSRHGLPTIQGVIALYDGESGYPLALLDSIEITALRTGAATAVTARYLARPDSRVAAVCGCGVQGRVQLKSLAQVLRLERVYAYDRDEALSATFAGEMSGELQVEIIPARDLLGALRESDVCITCTPSRRPFLMREHVRDGTFVADVGADNHLKQELDPALMASNKVVVDVLEQCASIGDLHHAIRAEAMSESDVYAELGEIVAAKLPGRTSNEETIIFDSTGTALQEVAAARVVYEKALGAGIGIRLDLAG